MDEGRYCIARSVFCVLLTLRKALLPLCTYCILRSGLIDGDRGWHLYAENAPTNTRPLPSGTGRLIIIATGLGAAVLANIWMSPPSVMLGVCGSVATACALLLLEEILRTQKQERTINSVDGLLRRPSSSSAEEREEAYITHRDTALVIAAFSLVASLSLERFGSGGFTYQPGIGIYDRLGPDWKTKQHLYDITRGVVGVVEETGKAMALLATVSFHSHLPHFQ